MTTSGGVFVTELAPEMVERLRADLEAQGFTFSQPPHTHFQAKKPGVSCTLYTSLKLTVQGKEKGPFLEFYLEPEVLKNTSFTYPNATLDLTGRIGIDESGKGDFFGPLCVAAIFAEGEQIKALKAMGIRDSKTLEDTRIAILARKIEAAFPHKILTLYPATYNDLYAKCGNLNSLLAWGHAVCAETVIEKTGAKKVVSDQFAHEGVLERAFKRKQLAVELIQRHRAEEDVVVAAASILARFHFVSALEALSRRFGVALPRGASTQIITVGRALVARYGPDILGEVGKVHFVTTKAILA